MTALAWAFAATVFVLWLIEHQGGADARRRLRKQAARAKERADLAIHALAVCRAERDEARRQAHPSRRLRGIDGGAR